MKSDLSLPIDKDTMMRRIARELAMDLYPLDKILSSNDVKHHEFDNWKEHPQFLSYLRQFKEEWNAATNTFERTKLKAGIVMEEFMEEAFHEMHNKKQALQHRTKLGELVAKIAGMADAKVANANIGGSGFSLSINIGQNEKVTISPHPAGPSPKTIDHASFEEYDPFTSPSTLDDE